MEAFVLPTLDESRRVATGGGSSLEQAAQIVAEAEAEAAAIRTLAAEEGRADGYAAGLADAAAALEPARSALAEAAAALREAQATLRGEAERAAVELALALAEKVIGAELASRPELVMDVATGALRGTIERGHLVLLVNPQDLELVRESADAVAASLGGIGRLEVASERRVPRGGCIVRTPDGEIDARVAEQLARAAEVLREAAAGG